MIDTPITSNNSETINRNTHNDSFITLCTLNIRGLNDPMKQTQLMNYAETQYYDIIGLTETHFTTYNNTYTFKNHPSYHAIWTLDTTQSHSGTGLLIHHSLSKFIIRTSQHLGRITTVDLSFKHHKSLRVIVVYLPPNNLPLNRQVSNKVLALLNECFTLHLTPIVMGDFNVNFEKLYHNLYHNVKLSSPKFGLLKRLINQGYIDSQLLFEPSPTPTFNNISRIDGIFLHSTIQDFLIHCYTDKCPLYNTDHNMVICAISKSDFITPHSTATQKSKHLKRKLLQFDHMNDELWNNFALKTDELIIESGLHQLESALTTLSSINSLNDSLEQILRTASNMIIPYKWSSDNYFDNKPKSLITTHQHF